jgi:murein DD-endopeptidase MepM/ murein hydrolase activator NlpD
MRPVSFPLRFPILACLTLSLGLPLGAAARQPPAKHPNFVFVYTDDQRWDATGVVQREQGERARFPWLKTPNMDRLAAEGIPFPNAFVVHSLCAPSRASDPNEALQIGTDLGSRVVEGPALPQFIGRIKAARIYSGEAAQPVVTPPMRTIDLNVGESQEGELGDGKKVRVKLLDLQETRDGLRSAVRKAEVKVELAGEIVTLVSANYRLPVTVTGIQIDCPITRGYQKNSTKDTSGRDPWGLDKDARLRLWPAGSPLINPGTFVYPIKQRWFASGTHMANEPCHVDGGENPLAKQIYYHYGLDMGGAEGLVEVVAATDGLVVSSGKAVLPGYDDTPVAPRYDVVYVLDARGWYYRYSHLHTIDPDVKPGARVKMGRRIGLLGKEGGSGGWSHLHFDISGRQPSGRWGIIEGYAFLWEAYLREHQPKLLAVARPHQLAAVGEKVVLDGSRSWSAAGKIAAYEWTFTDGKSATEGLVERTYSKPGVYSEVLKVTDGEGRVDYDFAVVNVLDKGHPEQLPPSIHAAYSPTFGIKSGDPVTFLVRTFRTTDGKETWDFGDGSARVTVQSDGNVVQLAKDGYARTVHRFEKPGHYLVRVERTDRRGFTAVAHLQVRVGQE